MSGHSKWKKIKHEKQAKDKQKGNIFSKLSRLITLAVIEGGGISDPENNVRLRLALEKAKQFNLPKDNIERAIGRGIGPDRLQLAEATLEAFAPSGVSLVILATTDNINRIHSEVKNVIESHGGKLGGKGSVMYLFKKCGLATFKIEAQSEESLFRFADKIGAFDIDKDEKYFYVYFPYESLKNVKEYLDGLSAESVDIDYKPNSLIEVNDKDAARKISELVAALEALDDVQKVFSNEKIL